MIVSEKDEVGLNGSEKPSLDIVVRGRVVDEKGQGLPGATVKLKGNESKVSIVTSSEGRFSVNVPGENAVLIVSYVGYKTKEVNVSGADVDLVIRLEPVTGQLEEVSVVSTGYQTIPKERSTGSFEKIDNVLLNRTNGSNILTRLEGIIPGLLVDRRLIREGKLSAGNVSIRGLSTLTQAIAVPLIVLDNFPYEGDVNNINPNDIESVTILKDAAAASIWGARAGNGVIVITTKKGMYDKPLQISFNTNLTVTEKPDLFAVRQMSSSDYIDVETTLYNAGFYDGRINNTRSYPYLSPVVELLAQTRPGGTLTLAEANAKIDVLRTYDVRNDYLKYVYRDAMAQQYALSLNGGGRQFSYSISGGYDKNNASIKTSNDYRATLRSDFSYSPVQNLEITAGTFYIQKVNRSAGAFSRLDYNKSILPYTRLADDEGNPLIVGRDRRVKFLNEIANPNYIDWRWRPLAEMNASSNTQKTYDLLLNLTAKYKFSQIISAEIMYQYGRTLTDLKNLQTQESYYTRNQINLLTQFNGSEVIRNLPLGSILGMTTGNNNLSNLRGQLNINKNWNDKHQLNAIAGVEQRENHTSSNSRNVYGYNDQLLTYADVDNKTQFISFSNFVSMPSGINFTDVTSRFTSFYANASYTYNNRYTFSASGRKDAANLFGVNTNLRGAPFYSGGLSWDISREPFYQFLSLPYLKLRTTYGYQGNTNPSLSAYSTIRYGSTNDPDTGLPYADLINPANEELRWERVGMLNFGIDFRLKNNILSGSIEYYTKNVKDALFTAPLDYTTGFRFTTYNSTGLKAKGLDLSFHSTNLSKTSLFKWNTDLILSYNVNKVTELKPVPSQASSFIEVTPVINIFQMVGRPVAAIYSYQWAGLDPQTGDPQGLLNGQISKDYDALINTTPDQLKYNGPATPVYAGAFRNTVSFKNFSLSANITAKFGHFFRRQALDYTALINTAGGIGHPDYSKRWQKPGDEFTTNVPSFIYPNDFSRDQFYAGSAALVEKADHIRLQDIIFSYTLNKPSWPVKNIRFFTNISNLGILWRANKLGIDPEFNLDYPAPRTIAFGLNANL
ncbi:hypothetical protein BFS30_01450 [Pedobacter steynii]|uniref:TonB-dependent receptor plug domain-containing protein n=1 Tax=Pedobacter steynii TaxID=430522 RepID=A0A1D7QPQ6_9SPHI|nr:hypothetical protein BFS30_01450 [Pedobacter steynii]